MKKITSGMWFSAIVCDVFCIGRIQEENGFWYLCQNELSGSNCNDKFGFKFCWGLGRQINDPFQKSTLIQQAVFHFKAYKEKPSNVVKPKFKVFKNNAMAVFYETVAIKGVGLSVGCSFFTADELKKFKRAIPKLQKTIKKFTGVAKGTYETHVLKTANNCNRYVSVYLNKMEYDCRFTLKLSTVNSIIDYIITK